MTGTLLAQGPRTVAAALRVMGLAHKPRFERDHRVLSRGRCSGVQGSQILLGLLMARPRHRTYPGMPLLPASIVPTLLPFAPLFTVPTRRHVQVLVTGTLLAQVPRTVATALRVMGLAHEPRFKRDHRVLSRGRWSGVQGS